MCTNDQDAKLSEMLPIRENKTKQTNKNKGEAYIKFQLFDSVGRCLRISCSFCGLFPLSNLRILYIVSICIRK